jgi:hypothetical protein
VEFPEGSGLNDLRALLEDRIVRIAMEVDAMAGLIGTCRPERVASTGNVAGRRGRRGYSYTVDGFSREAPTGAPAFDGERDAEIRFSDNSELSLGVIARHSEQTIASIL